MPKSCNITKPQVVLLFAVVSL